MLSSEQAIIADAVVSRTGNNLTVALPGSGKSTTCIAGLVKLLEQNRKARPWMVTFTRAATTSIANKLRLLLSKKDFDRVGVSTFHGIILEQYKTLPKQCDLIMDGRFEGKVSEAMMACGYMGEHDEAKQTIDLETRQLNMDVNTISTITRTYLSVLEERNLIDFNLMCREVVFGLRKGAIKRLAITHMIVDEFQDTDEVQLAWMEEHALSGVSITAVGDDDQSIYSFRGGLGFKIMSQFTERFDAKTYYLSTCYRCGGDILKAAERIITTNQGRIPKEMKAAADHAGNVTIIQAANRELSYESLVENITRHTGSWAVLARTGFHLDKIELLLHSQKIACRRTAGRSIWTTSTGDSLLRVFRMILNQNVDDSAHYALTALMKLQGDDLNEFEKRGAMNISAALYLLPESKGKQLLQVVTTVFADTINPVFIKRNITLLTAAIEQLVEEKKNLAIARSILKILEESTGSWHERLTMFVGRLTPTRENKELKLEPTVVVLTTLHGSKGLEWDNVAIVDCNVKSIPSPKVDTEEGIEEERRLMYVGMTRAIHRLELHTHGGRSHYLDELLLDRLLPVKWVRYLADPNEPGYGPFSDINAA